ncbi:lithostathine-2 [Folsomia candida]|uniref:lithostathine-2 n=1 Tax=Folsomia candida TaxID=158441 RepID=UPI000B8EF415|nr:lithostathine-2 [Folsomia candida]
MTSISNIVIAIAFLFLANSEGSLTPKNLSQSDIDYIENQGFRYLTPLEEIKGAQPRWSYFLSKNKISMTDALGMCGVLFEGRLLTIYTKDEDEYIRILLQIEGIGPANEYVATSGRWNSVVRRWEWGTTLTELIYSNFRPSTPVGTQGQCVAVVGELSSYVWSAVNCLAEMYYICQF